MKREKQEMIPDIEALRKQLDQLQNEKEQVSVASSTGSQKSGVSDRGDHEILDNVLEKDNDLTSEQNFLDKLLSKKASEQHADSSSEKSERRKSRKNAGATVTAASPDDPLVQERVKLLQMKLDEALRTLQVERE